MILDIELRFVEREVIAYPGESGIARRVRMLQSRKLVRLVDGRGATYNAWTDWADVPLAPQAGAAKVGDRG